MGVCRTFVHVTDGKEAEHQNRFDVKSGEMLGVPTDNGYLVVEGGYEILRSEKILSKLSALGELFQGMVEEHCAYSHIEAWSDGKKIWSSKHEGMTSAKHLVVTGNPPPVFYKIKSELEKEMQEKPGAWDYLGDLAVQVFERFSGFRYDYQEEYLPQVHFKQCKFLKPAK